MASATPVNPKTGKPLDGVELAAFEREKRKAQDQIVQHAELGCGSSSACGRH